MDRFRMRSREVEAAKVTAIRPLVVHGAMVPASAGVTLVLTDQSTVAWQSDGGNTPKEGDWAVHDLGFSIRFIVPEKSFNFMFRKAEGCL